MNKNKAKELVIEWVDYSLDNVLDIPNATLGYFTLQFIDFLYLNKYKVISSLEVKNGKERNG